MIKIKSKFIYDNKGKKRVGVILKVKDFEKLIDELEDIQDYEFIRKHEGKVTKNIPLEEAFKSILRKK